MSAFVVGKEHIDALVTAGLDASDPLSWYWGDENEHRAELRFEDADRVGAMLLAENVASVNYRYSEDELEYVYLHASFPRAFGAPLSPVAILKAIACFEYQSCEHPGWESSEAYAFCDSLRRRMIGRLDGYSEAAWEIRPVGV